jgi:hypothetical protein
LIYPSLEKAMNLSDSALQVAVVTGGHAFDVPNFHRLFRRLDGIDAYIQTMGDFAASPQETRDAYAVVVFYHMLKETPSDEGKPWYDGKPQIALERLGATGQGLVVMHHSLLAYPQWPTWRKLSGIDPTWTRYDHDQHLQMHMLNASHPITAGLDDFALVDETYGMGEPDPGCDILMTTENPYSLKAQAWVHTFERSRVFSLVLGHDNQAWSNPGFEMILRRGIVWASGKNG